MAKGSRYKREGGKWVDTWEGTEKANVEDAGYGAGTVPMPSKAVVPMPEGYEDKPRWGEKGHETMFRTRDDAHEFLQGVGMAPGGVWADILDAGLYMSEGDWWNMALSMGAAIPIIGTAASSVRMSGKVANKVAKGQELVKASKHGENVDIVVHPNGAMTKKSTGELLDINKGGEMVAKASESTGSQLKYSHTNKTLGPRVEPKDPLKGFTPEEIAAHNAKVAESGKHSNINIAGRELGEQVKDAGAIGVRKPGMMRAEEVMSRLQVSPATRELLERGGVSPAGIPAYRFNPLNVPREEYDGPITVSPDRYNPERDIEIGPATIPGIVPED